MSLAEARERLEEAGWSIAPITDLITEPASECIDVNPALGGTASSDADDDRPTQQLDLRAMTGGPSSVSARPTERIEAEAMLERAVAQRAISRDQVEAVLAASAEAAGEREPQEARSTPAVEVSSGGPALPAGEVRRAGRGCVSRLWLALVVILLVLVVAQLIAWWWLPQG